ncbi:TIGR03013 family XrtA/PEP-CTERM system glycosyltransferase [Polyangium jinanense]|uniref:TIGR03013 family PEP-CTERM/XrtA system glycosyltransferase n=1 Tax=Polyangium jinanense TaxID=2829994 RepID=A0A9X3XAA5_9BACT|nr:TIGR03013 family XrtA/PEP-CTERM system glycosyltransferase [Polyangium jinanense]MDC3958731.1 TIGR03013 family PEP-CTERM/XrtA system glycosyltransferase [Polyangium jinanense]MDC3985288.1 TIGR03013 family PEP-CTERM/XrtA system glycosyltransferase [Polyangium jinanense]
MLELFRSRRRAIVWFVEAALLVSLVCAGAAAIEGYRDVATLSRVLDAAAITLVAQASLYYHGLYGPSPIRDLRTLAWKVARALAVSVLLLWLVFQGFSDDAGERFGAVALGLAAGALVLPLFRTGLARAAASDRLCKRTLVLGSGPLADAVITGARTHDTGGMRFVGRLVQEGDPGRAAPDVLGTYDELPRIAAAHGVRHIIVCAADRRGKLPIDALLELKFRGIEIEEGVEFYERITGKIFVRELRPSQLVFAHGFRVAKRTLLGKRILDVVCASLGLVLASPLMLLTALAIKLDSAGPVLYSQVRAGVYGRPFTIYKFRSMRTDAEADGKARWASEDDPRVTRVGRFIRKTRLDELPQLWNVLAGDMSLVGPRPERPNFTEELEKAIPFFRQRLFVKPGLTGYAQVRYHYGATTEDQLEKLQHDLFYIKTLSVWFDLSILLDTVKVVLLRIGAR